MEFLYLQSVLFLVFVAVYYYHRSAFKQNEKTKAKLGFILIGDTPEYLKNRHNFLDWNARILKESPANTIVLLRPGTAHGIITANPAVVEHILKTNFENYPKGRRFITVLQEFLGQGIFNADGELWNWKVQRKTASYEFNTKSLRNFVLDTVAVEIKERLIPVLKNASAANQVLDLQDIFERFAFDNICKLAFNFETECLGGKDESMGKEFMRAFDEASKICSERFMGVFEFTFKIKKFFNIGSERRLKKSVSTVHKFFENIIKSRLEKKDGKKDEDLLSRFIGHEENSPEFLRDIIINFMLAGRDTTSSAMSWFFWLISRYPQVKEKILEELKFIRAKTHRDIGETYTFDEIRDMHYLHAALTESMRLYPPVPLDSKEVIQDDVLPDGTFVGKGWFVTYTAYGMGRMEAIWGKNCNEFVPERWLENGVFKPESLFRYPIFHAGPRLCLGKDMAYIQMKAAAAAVMERFELDVLETPVPLLSLTLRMKRGMPVSVKEIGSL